MKIIDNFLSDQQLADLYQSLTQDINPTQTINDYSGDTIPGQEIQLYEINGTTKTSFWNYLKENNIVTGNCNAMLRYHVMTSQTCIKWHYDYTPSIGEETKYLGITLFLNKDWDDNYGGFYLYKHNPTDSSGYFVSPIENRLVINHTDLFHGVSAINQGSDNISRYSLQWFIHQDCFVTEYR
jgi:hypothetical protein